MNLPSALTIAPHTLRCVAFLLCWLSQRPTLLPKASNKRVSAYTKSDAVAFIDGLLCLPANWRKDKKLRHLEIGAAAQANERNLLPNGLR
jgi:hypothetical protein